MNTTREEALFALRLEKPTDMCPAFLDATSEADPALRQRRDQMAVYPPRPERQPTEAQSTPFLQERLDLTPRRVCYASGISKRSLLPWPNEVVVHAEEKRFLSPTAQPICSSQPVNITNNQRSPL